MAFHAIVMAFWNMIEHVWLFGFSVCTLWNVCLSKYGFSSTLCVTFLNVALRTPFVYISCSVLSIKNFVVHLHTLCVKYDCSLHTLCVKYDVCAVAFMAPQTQCV